MQIGNQFAEDKLYRGIKHYDGRPLLSEDLHEFSDTLYKKSSYFTNSLIGSGTLNEPPLTYSSDGVFLSTPSVLLIDGDIVLVQSDNPLLKVQDIKSTGLSEGLLCIVGWYQNIDANSTMRAYGGVSNHTLDNKLYNEQLGIQPTSRFQFIWDTVLVGESLFRSSGSIDIELKNRSSDGVITSGVTTITATKSGGIRVASKPSSMDYAVSDLYIVPVLKYKYTGTVFNNTAPVKPLNIGGSEVIKSEVEPTGDLVEGTLWYRPSTQKFRIYVEGVGFVSPSSDVVLQQESNTIVFESDSFEDGNIPVEIGIESYESTDILNVVYEGLVLTQGVQYVLDSANKSILLTNFSVKSGDHITFIATKLMNVDVGPGGNPVYPPYEGSPVITDSVTGQKYSIVIANGVLGVSEVE